MGPIRDTIQELKLCVIRMRLCSLSLRYNTSDTTPSGPCIQVATTYHIPSTTWGCVCSEQIKEHVLDWYGQSQRHAEWRAHMRTTCATHLLGYICRYYSRSKREVAYLMAYTLTDRGMQRYVTTQKGGPDWDTVGRRVTVNMDTGHIIQSI